MAPHAESEPNPACSSGCFVGLLEARELQDKDYTDHLSIEERAKYVGLPSPSRKSEWLAGRLAAKYLFLNWLEMSQRTQSQQWKPILSRLTSKALGVYSPWTYQKVEVLPNDWTASRYTKLVWCGKERPESISLSHADSVSCACVAFGKPTAIDIETAVPRIAAFYRNNFTEAERHWATHGTDGESARSNWLFTLLWSLKESALKLGWLKQTSLWNLPRIELDGLPSLNYLGPFWSSSVLGDDFVVFTVRVKEACRVMQVRVAVTGTRNFILTVMNPLIGAAK
jgi:4'-phosphopantetheinyl transferase EntD